MNTRGRLAESLWPRDVRSTAEIDDGIRAELEAHVELLVVEQVRAGVPEEEARRQAVAQFGDVDRYAAECRRIDLGDRLVVRRALAAACAALVAMCGYLGWRVWQGEQTAARLRQELARSAAQAPTGQNQDKDSREAWVNRLASLRDHMHTAFGVGPELTLLPADEGLAIVREAWPRIEIQEVKTGLLKTFAFSKALKPQKHPRVLQVLHLGMMDQDPEIRGYAAAYVSEFSDEDFGHDSERYQAWYRKHADSPVDDVLRQAQLELTEGLRSEEGQR